MPSLRGIHLKMRDTVDRIIELESLKRFHWMWQMDAAVIKEQDSLADEYEMLRDNFDRIRSESVLSQGVRHADHS
jgi:hypothetical protein